jgi:hypothetical protein
MSAYNYLMGFEALPGERSGKNVFNYIEVWVSLHERLDDWETSPNWCPKRKIWHNAHGIMETPNVSDLMKFWWVYGDDLPETPPGFWEPFSAIMIRDDYDEAYKAIAKEWEEQERQRTEQYQQERFKAEQDQQKRHRAEQAEAVRQAVELEDMLE